MTSRKSYQTVVVNLSDPSDAPVKFTMAKTLARSEFQLAQEPVAPLPRQNLATGCDPALIQKAPEAPLANPRFKVEVGFTTKYNVLICRTTYSQVKNDKGQTENKKDKTYTQYPSISAARSSLDASAPADAACAYQMKDLKDWAAVETAEV